PHVRFSPAGRGQSTVNGDHKTAENDKFFRRVFARCLKAHRAKGRHDVSLPYLVGEDRLTEGFFAERVRQGL
ncbi:unnamed protein product, partial [Scytosiphon promiscuus]